MAASNKRSYTMAAEAATEIVSQKLEILLSHPVQLGCLSMETQANAAKEKLAMIQKFFSTQDGPSDSTEWLMRLLRAMFDAEVFIDKFHLRDARWRHMATRPLTVLVPKYMLYRDLSNLVNDIEELCQDQNVISIVGEQGTGKTFLARLVYKEAMYLGFNPRAWVHVSAGMDTGEFLFEILKQVDNLVGDMRGMSLYQITDKLYKQLATTKKFLIVLDDVQPSNEQLLQRFLMILPLPSEGCIITTTRDDGIAKAISPHEDLIMLIDFGQEEIQKMLAKKLHRAPDAKSLTDVEKAMIERCRGLPLYISLLGGLLSNAGEHERTALPKDGPMMTLSDILELSYHRLPNHLKPCFIYMALFPVASPIPTKRLVRLWLAEGLLDLYCHNREVNTTRLPEDVGETFILELADRNMIDVVSWRGDGSPKACQMLTSLYDMILLIAKSTGLLHIHAAGKSKDRNNHDPTGQQQQLPAQTRERARVRWLAEHMSVVTDSSGGSYPDLNLDHVRSFLSFYPRRGILTKDISKFLRKLTSKTDYSLLRVLDLEGVYKPSLQGVLHKLVLLRYLGLRSTVLDSIPREVADLHYLETLDIKHTNITSLPSSLWKARNLRHLHINWFYVNLKKILKACSNNDMALAQLQTLSGLVIGEVNENLMRDHTDSLTTLTTLKLFLQRSDTDTDTSGAAGKAVADWISFRLTNLQSLTFGVIQEAMPRKEAEPAKETKPSHIGPSPKLSLAEKHHNLFKLYLLGQLEKPIWTELLPGSLRVLTLSGSKVKIDMMPELGGLLRNLRTLRLLADSFLGTSLRFIKDGFPSLMILKIWRLPQLEKVIIEQGAMQHLKELECRFLKSMKVVEGIEKCEELETICVVVKKGAKDFGDRLKKEARDTTNPILKTNSVNQEGQHAFKLNNTLIDN
ncbi:disease resistance protein RPM1-like [Syzygium oleosum]|uniref:disease resistance protein RPM1-like n=1 Tax=Syzygium oleosum TaxID=219896 RepID=UPI0024BBEB51|nr:disease resistance protein RPM1-like [Syzygium oleosum]